MRPLGSGPPRSPSWCGSPWADSFSCSAPRQDGAPGLLLSGRIRDGDARQRIGRCAGLGLPCLAVPGPRVAGPGRNPGGPLLPHLPGRKIRAALDGPSRGDVPDFSDPRRPLPRALPRCARIWHAPDVGLPGLCPRDDRLPGLPLPPRLHLRATAADQMGSLRDDAGNLASDHHPGAPVLLCPQDGRNILLHRTSDRRGDPFHNVAHSHQRRHRHAEIRALRHRPSLSTAHWSTGR
jgi:hypothetical protein